MESVSSEEDNTIPQENRDLVDEEGSVVFQSRSPYPRDEGKRKKSCKSRCINGSLVGLKTLLFIFYGGIGTISSWLNHTHISSRFNERESLLIYGLSALLSLPVPIIFGLFSDKTAQPKKVLGICLFLAGLLYPLIMAVPPADPYRYKERLDWCNKTLASASNSDSDHLGNPYTTTSSCVPNRLTCGPNQTELITDYGGCSEGCSGKLLLTNCKVKCNDSAGDAVWDYNEIAPLPEALVQNDYDQGSALLEKAPPHLCVKENPQFKYKDLCFAFDKDMHEIGLHAEGISGFVDADGKCHYPLTGYSDKSGELRSLLSCSPLSAHCHVHCDLRWDPGQDDQWTCHSDFVQWLISFISFVAIHTLGTMLVISAAGLLSSAILSMSHEHSGYFGCQYMYAALGYLFCPPGVVFLFDFIHANLEVPWKLEYLGAFGAWLLACALLVSCLPYHAEWVPKPKTVGPMLRRWTYRGHTFLFFKMLVSLGFLHVLNEVLSFHQIKGVAQGSLLILALGASATVLPALLFIFRVDKVIDYCGHPSLLAIALVVLSLQFTGYAYLVDAEPEWSFLLKAMETFSVFMVWITASYTTYASAPRSLSATCQTVIATLYCCIGRGFGGLVGYVGLTFIPKDLFLKILSLLSVFICVLFLIVYYCCLKPLPYTKQYELERPGSAAPSGRYTPLKLINGKNDKNLAKDEDLDEKDIGPEEL